MAVKEASPDGTVQYVRPASVGKQRYGTELVLCAPPSFSALLATTPEHQWHRIFEAHAAARDRTLNDLLRRDFVARTGAGGTDRTPCRPIAATLPHYCSRRGTPLVHDHTVILKQGYCPVDGKARTVETDPVFQNQRQVRADHGNRNGKVVKDRVVGRRHEE